MSELDLSVLDEIRNNMNILFDKGKKMVTSDSEKIVEMGQKISLFYLELNDINRRLEESINDFNREQLILNEDEKYQLEQNEIIERAMDRIKPMMLLSLLMENNFEEYRL